MRWLGAVQAQDYHAAKWALALRMRSATHALVEAAFNNGEIIRTHLLRPTWHFVAPEDIRWMLALTAPHVNRKCAGTYRRFEIDDAVVKRSRKVFIKALQGGKHLTRGELRAALNKAGLAADDTVRMGHILLRAELDGLICSGPRAGKQFTYALFDERVPPGKTLSREEALAELTRRYFNSHGPATLQDFIWWSGFSTIDAKRGMELYKPQMTRIKNRIVHPSHLLPAFDEYFVAYKERETITGLNNWDVLGPTVIINGRTVGTWKRTNENDVSLNLLRPVNKTERLALADATHRYLTYLES